MRCLVCGERITFYHYVLPVRGKRGKLAHNRCGLSFNYGYSQGRLNAEQRILKLIDKRIKYAGKESPENVKVMALNKFKKEIEPIEMLEFVKFVVAEELKAIKKQIKRRE